MSSHCNNFVNGLQFKTSLGRHFNFGGDAGIDTGSLTKEATSPVLVAIGAGMGACMHHLKCFYLDLADLQDVAEYAKKQAPLIPYHMIWKLNFEGETNLDITKGAKVVEAFLHNLDRVTLVYWNEGSFTFRVS